MDQLTITFKNCPPGIKESMEICFVTVPVNHMEVTPLELSNELVLDMAQIPEHVMRANATKALFDLFTIYAWTELKKRDHAG